MAVSHHIKENKQKIKGMPKQVVWAIWPKTLRRTLPFTTAHFICPQVLKMGKENQVRTVAH